MRSSAPPNSSNAPLPQPHNEYSTMKANAVSIETAPPLLKSIPDRPCCAVYPTLGDGCDAALTQLPRAVNLARRVPDSLLWLAWRRWRFAVANRSIGLCPCHRTPGAPGGDAADMARRSGQARSHRTVCCSDARGARHLGSPLAAGAVRRSRLEQVTGGPSWPPAPPPLWRAGAALSAATTPPALWHD